MKSILGIDLSLNSTGLCIKTNSLPPGWTTKKGYSFFLVDFPRPTKKHPGPTREEKWDTIVNKVEFVAGYADHVILEDYAFGAIGRGKSILCEIGGIVRYTLNKKRVPYTLVSPSTLKRFLGSVSSKSMVPKEVLKRWKIDVDSDDLADALVLVKIGEAIEDPDADHVTIYQRAALEAAKLI
ncbi:MAG: hypothetical protein ACE5E2_05900 [Candidatus Binatia bacterium]